ncbi:hypothetical protein FOXYSP1_13153, partial [Fusarium oxysporum f. sp. phaseoli]
RTHSTSSKRSIAIDIGAGSGQWSETFKEIPGCSFLLGEPDADKCKLLSRRLSVALLSVRVMEMPRLGCNLATVKWGRDKQYEEPVVEEEDLPITCSPISALNMVPISLHGVPDAVTQICSQVKTSICS